jgi:hypothetical protein
MPVVKHQRPSHKAKSRGYLREWDVSARILEEARALARTGQFANHQEIARELHRLSRSERAQNWFGRVEFQAQLDLLCEVATSRHANPVGSN